jgi:hypothetical protein
MSEMGQGQTFNSVRIASALTLITDLERKSRHVGYGPIGDVVSATVQTQSGDVRVTESQMAAWYLDCRPSPRVKNPLHH